MIAGYTASTTPSKPEIYMEYPATAATVETLPNGLTLILDPDPTAPVVSAQIWVETGSMHEDRHLGAGVSHFLEHMVFKGTRDFDADELADTVQAAGGHWNAYTTFERTVYYIDGPAVSLPVFLKCLTGIVFSRDPGVGVREGKGRHPPRDRHGLDDPDNAATRLMLASAFQHDPRRHPVIGHRHRFDAIAYDDLVRYQKERYTTDRCFVVISGDFDPDEARESLATLTAECLQGCGREPLVARIRRSSARGGRVKPSPSRPAGSRSHGNPPPSIIRTPRPSMCSPPCLAAAAPPGSTARFARNAASPWKSPPSPGAAPGAKASSPSPRMPNPAKRDALIEAIHLELATIHTDPSGEDFAKAKRQIAASQFRSLTTASGRASDLASNWHEARDLDFTRRHVAAIQAVTEDDIRRAASQLTDERLTLTILDPLDAPAPARAGKIRRSREEIEVHTLPTALQLALIPDRRVPLVHLQAAVRAGLPSETPETNGLNQLLASTLPKGTATRSAARSRSPSNRWARRFPPARETTRCKCRPPVSRRIWTPSSQCFPKSSPRRACRMTPSPGKRPASSPPWRRRCRTRCTPASARSATPPSGAGGYGLDALGSPASLTALDRAALAAHHARHFNAANITLAIAGDFDSAAALDHISTHLGALPAGNPWPVPAGAAASGGDTVVRLPKKQAVLAIGFPGTSVSGPDRHTLAFIQEYAADMAGPLFIRIREELGLAYQVGATQFLGYDAGLFTFYLATSPEQADLARLELLAEIAQNRRSRHSGRGLRARPLDRAQRPRHPAAIALPRRPPRRARPALRPPGRRTPPPGRHLSGSSPRGRSAKPPPASSPPRPPSPPCCPKAMAGNRRQRASERHGRDVFPTRPARAGTMKERFHLTSSAAPARGPFGIRSRP
jgi:zinc protease